MRESADGQLKKSTRQRLLGRLEAMVRSGRVTSEEAARLRAAGQADDFDATVVDIRVRHARSRLDAAVETGAVTRGEADAFLERLRRGEHGTALRAHLRDLSRSARRAGPAPPDPPEDPGP